MIFVHFHSFPFTDKTSCHNAIALAKKLTRFQYSTRIYLVPLAMIQQAIIDKVPARYRIILYRRVMLRIAESIAKKEHARALVTGDSLGQVASQTLENISVISAVVSIPILRPLIGMDKEKIIDQARKIDTYSISIEPCQDSCGYMIARRPETRAELENIISIESGIENMQILMEDALRQTEPKVINFP